MKPAPEIIRSRKERLHLVNARARSPQVATPSEGLDAPRTAPGSRSHGFFQRLNKVCSLPREAAIRIRRAAEVAIGAGA